MNIQIRKAVREDLIEIVRLLADDTLGIEREKFNEPLPAEYYAAFDEIDSDKNNYLVVAELNNQIIGTLQLTLITHLIFQGGKRGLIEGVRIDKAFRGQGLGKAMLEWTIQKAREAGCKVVQLTTNKKRIKAQSFYTKLGFTASHEGMKLYL